MRRKILFFITISLFILCGCQNKEPISKSAFLLDTIITIQIYDSNDSSLLDGSIELCEQYESLWSKTIETSEISIINNAQGNTVQVSDETVLLLQTAIEYSELSKGAFDITVKPLSDLWDFTGENPSVPNYLEINSILEHVDYRTIHIEENNVTLLDKDASIDVGALAKGYISDQIKSYLIDNGVTSAIINLGGNVLTIGNNITDEPFKIGIQQPFSEENEMIGYLNVTDQSVVTSGIYERYFLEDDIIYHHILNPSTGYPFSNDLVGVTIISDSSLQGDILSTTCFALGLEESLKLVENLENVEAIFITNDNQIIQTTENLVKE